MRITKEDIDAMSYEEKRKLLDMLWESFENNGEENYADDLPEETEEELQILQERLEEYKKNPEQFVDGEKFFKEELERLRVSKKDIDEMSNDEKQQLFDMLRESIHQEEYTDDESDETEEELQILQERLEEYKKDPSTGIPWEEAKKELMKKYRD